MKARTPHRAAKSPLARLSAQSLYESCAGVLKHEIATGVLRPGQRLPSERVLGAALGFSRLTVRRALQALAANGKLERDTLRGWQVRSEPVSEAPNTLMGFTQMARQRGLIATSRVLSLQYREATFDEAESLRVGAGVPMLELVRLRLLDDRPTAIECMRMPTSRARWPPNFDFTGSIYGALESQGVIPTRADAYVEVIAATDSDAQLLGVAPGRGLLRMNCLTFGADGMPIGLESSRYHPDRYRFHAILERSAASAM